MSEGCTARCVPILYMTFYYVYALLSHMVNWHRKHILIFKVCRYKIYTRSICFKVLYALKCADMSSLENSSRVSQSHFFREEQTLGSPDQAIQMVDVLPIGEIVGVPVVMAPGWSEGPVSFQKSQNVLARNGRRSLVFEHPRRGGPNRYDHPWPAAEVRKALNLLEVAEYAGGQVDVIAHSEAGIYALIAALIEPNRIRNIVLVGPAGLQGKDNIFRLTGRMTKKVIRNLYQGWRDPNLREDILRTHMHAGHYIVQNPVRALSEAWAVSQTDTTKMFDTIRKNGTGVVLVHHADDEAMPMKRIQQNAKATMFDGVIAITGLHDDLYVHPEIFTAAAERMLTALESKQATYARSQIT